MHDEFGWNVSSLAAHSPAHPHTHPQSVNMEMTRGATTTHSHAHTRPQTNFQNSDFETLQEFVCRFQDFGNSEFGIRDLGFGFLGFLDFLQAAFVRWWLVGGWLVVWAWVGGCESVYKQYSSKYQVHKIGQ